MSNRDWEDAVLENIPNGEEGSLQLEFEDAVQLAKLLLKYGYVTLFSSGDIGNTVRVSWIYAGHSDNLRFADCNSVCFTSRDYSEGLLDMYYEAMNAAEDDEKSDE